MPCAIFACAFFGYANMVRPRTFTDIHVDKFTALLVHWNVYVEVQGNHTITGMFYLYVCTENNKLSIYSQQSQRDHDYK